MSYADYLRRVKINSPVVIDTQMRMPDASSFTWRTKMAATSVNQRSKHVINNTFDPSSTPYLRHQVLSFPGNGFGGKVQDASSYTLSLGSTSLGRDNFSSGKIVTNTVNSSGSCLTRPPASQVVSEFGNGESSTSGLNMGYTRQQTVNGVVDNVGVCTSKFFPLTKSYFVDTIPELKTRKIGSSPQVVSTQTAGGLQVVQDPIVCTTTDTIVGKGFVVDSNGINLPILKDTIPFNSYSAPPNNSIGSGANLVHGRFVTSRTGPQTGGGNTPGSRAAIVGGVTLLKKRSITHRGVATRTRTPYPNQFVPPRGAPAHLKINDPTHYKV